MWDAIIDLFLRVYSLGLSSLFFPRIWQNVQVYMLYLHTMADLASIQVFFQVQSTLTSSICQATNDTTLCMCKEVIMSVFDKKKKIASRKRMTCDWRINRASFAIAANIFVYFSFPLSFSAPWLEHQMVCGPPEFIPDPLSLIKTLRGTQQKKRKNCLVLCVFLGGFQGEPITKNKQTELRSWDPPNMNKEWGFVWDCISKTFYPIEIIKTKFSMYLSQLSKPPELHYNRPSHLNWVNMSQMIWKHQKTSIQPPKLPITILAATFFSK